jgi:hypothetical protein
MSVLDACLILANLLKRGRYGSRFGCYLSPPTADTNGAGRSDTDDIAVLLPRPDLAALVGVEPTTPHAHHPADSVPANGDPNHNHADYSGNHDQRHPGVAFADAALPA